jgi:hypothetical protein
MRLGGTTLSTSVAPRNTNRHASKIASGRRGQTTRRRINRSNPHEIRINGKTRMSKITAGIAGPQWTYYDGIGAHMNGQAIQRIYLPHHNWLYRIDNNDPGLKRRTAYARH